MGSYETPSDLIALMYHFEHLAEAHPDRHRHLHNRGSIFFLLPSARSVPKASSSSIASHGLISASTHTTIFIRRHAHIHQQASWQS